MKTEKQAGMPDVIYTYHDGFQVRLTDFESEDADAFKTHVFIRRAIVTPEAADEAMIRFERLMRDAVWFDDSAETIRALLIAHGGNHDPQ